MRVLIACEFSGIVRDAFAAKGHDAWSCDLLPTERPGQHLQEDAIWCAYNRQWDLMIAHPPCTYLSRAGKAWWNLPGRAEKRRDALFFFNALLIAPIYKISVENPIGEAWRIRRPDQQIEPWFFGDPHRKRTCLWLKNLAPLEHRAVHELFGPSTHVAEPCAIKVDNTLRMKKRYFTDTRKGKARSITFPGIARAMADQWG